MTILGRLGAIEQSRSDGLAASWQLRFSRLDAPRFVRDTTHGDAARSVTLHDHANRNEGKRIRRAIAHLVIDLRPTDRLGQDNCGNQLTRLQRRLDLRRIARQSMRTAANRRACATTCLPRWAARCGTSSSSSTRWAKARWGGTASRAGRCTWRRSFCSRHCGALRSRSGPARVVARARSCGLVSAPR